MSRRPSSAAVAVAVAVAVMSVTAGCRNDGRDLRDPSEPLPPTTTTTTTLPPDIVAPTVAP